MLPPASRRTCTACRSAKVKCDRAGPICGRCRRLGLPCVEQVRKQGRPTLTEQPRYYSEGGGDAPGAAATAAAAAGGGNGYHHLPPVVPTALLPSPLASVPSSLGVPYHHPVPAPEAVTRGLCGPQVVAEYVLAAFDKLRATGAVDQPRTLSLLRTMALQSLCWNQDYSCGLLDPLLGRMGLALPDLESESTEYPEDSSCGCLARWGVRLGAGYDESEGCDGGSGEGTQAAAAPAEVGGAEGQQPQRPQQEEEGPNGGDDSPASAASSLGVAFGRIPPRLLSLDDRVSACCCTLTISGAATRVIVNQQFSDLFCPAADLQARILASPVPPPFTYAALVAPDDRLDFLEAMAAYLFSSSSNSNEGETELSQIVRMRDCFDAPFLAIARLRVLSLAGGAYLGTMLAVTPAPSSKYIRGGNREEQHGGIVPYSRLGLNYAEGRFRTRQPSAGMGELRGGVFVADNVAAEPVHRFFGEGGGGRAVLAAAVERYRRSASSGAAGGSGGAAAAGGAEEVAAGVDEQKAAVPSPAGGDGGVVVGVKRSRPSEEEEGEQEEHGEGEAAAAPKSLAAAQPEERSVEA